MNERLDLDYEFKIWSIFNQASEAAIKFFNNALCRDLGISYIQLAVMYVIKTSGKPLSPTQISRILLREPHGMAALINRMEENGLVKQIRDSQVKNIKIVSLTQKGEDIYSEAVIDELCFQFLCCLSPKEKETLFACSEKIRNSALEQLTVRRIWEPLFYPA